MSASDPKEIAARIRVRIAEMGISESELAERDGKTRSVYSTILRGLMDGSRKNLSRGTLARFKGVTPKILESVGKMRVPSRPKVFDAAFVGALARLWDDAT